MNSGPGVDKGMASLPASSGPFMVSCMLSPLALDPCNPISILHCICVTKLRCRRPINADKTVIINARETTARASQSELDKKTSITRNIHRDLSVSEYEWAESIGILGHGLVLKVLTFSRPF